MNIITDPVMLKTKMMRRVGMTATHDISEAEQLVSLEDASIALTEVVRRRVMGISNIRQPESYSPWIIRRMEENRYVLCSSEIGGRGVCYVTFC